MKELLVSNSETAMRNAFEEQSGEVLHNESRFKKPKHIVRVGLEMEAGVMGDGGRAADEAERNCVIGGIPFADAELGASQVEWRTEPIVINQGSGFSEMVDQVVDRNSIMDEAAHAQGLHILRLGANPFIPISEIKRTSKNKYQMVPDFHNTHRLRTDTLIGTKDQIDVADAAVVGLLSSLQCNLEASDFTDAVNLTNRSLMIAPLVSALSGNARMLEGKDTGFADIRMSAWERSHDTRTIEEISMGKALRVGMPDSYFTDLSDYFNRISLHPFILDDPEHALLIGIGLFWQDTRIKVVRDSLVVEFRPISIQPSVEEDLAVMMFYLGRLFWSKQHDESFIPMHQVRYMRNVAMCQGIQPFIHKLPHELCLAREGLLGEGIPNDITDGLFTILEDRIRKRQTPADGIGGYFEKQMNISLGNRSDALNHLFNNLV